MWPFKKKKIYPAPDYKKLWENLLLDEKSQDMLKEILPFLVKNIEIYKKLEVLTGCPWFVCFCIHYKESSLSFKGVLHNGDTIIGTGKTTYNVPKGRGPFLTWIDAGVDAINMEKNNFPKVWTIPECLLFCEKYNGVGHRAHGNGLSPYIFAFTSVMPAGHTGNYKTDGKYDENAPIKTVGVACIIKFLELKGML